MRTIPEVQADIGIIVNPADGRSWYRLLGSDFGDWDTTCGHYRRTDEDGTLVLIRDDNMTEVRAYPHGPGGPGATVASGWRGIIDADDEAPNQTGEVDRT